MCPDDDPKPKASQKRGSREKPKAQTAASKSETKDSAQGSRRKVSTKPRAPAKKPRPPTWLTPFGTAWITHFGGRPAYGELARHLAPVCADHPQGEVLEHWRRYLEATEARYVSPARFAQTYGKWGKPERPKTELGVPDMYLTLEEQAARRARLAKAPTPLPNPAKVSDVLPRVLPRP